DAVVNYVLAALLSVFQRQPDQLATKMVSVLGAGNVGGRLVKQLRALGLAVQVYDPPRAQREGTEQEIFVDLKTALSAEVVCCHTPLTVTGDFPSSHLLTAELLAGLPPDAIFINAGRGGLVSGAELQVVMERRPDVRWVMDVWDPEPAIPLPGLPLTTLATGHIAGHSSEGKVRGTWMLRQGLAERLSLAPSALAPQDLLPPAPTIKVDTTSLGTPWQTAAWAVQQVYDITADDARFRLAMAQTHHGLAFDQYRRTYPPRREYQSTQVVNAHELPAEHRSVLQAMGFILK
ncbi:MAG: DUF3410 domain-containing protein, partial [Natronospirillum sp.]